MLIKRVFIFKLGFYIDTFITRCPSPFIVTYKGKFNLTDRHFQENQVILTNGKSLCLYKNADIESITVNNKGK